MLCIHVVIVWINKTSCNAYFNCLQLYNSWTRANLHVSKRLMRAHREFVVVFILNCTILKELWRARNIHIHMYVFDGRFGVVMGIFAFYARGRGSIVCPAQCKHLCAWTCLFVLGLGVSMYNMYLFKRKM
jgi:hypothetical protein